MTTLGGLEVRILPSAGPARCAALLCHGFGASGDDLVGIGHELQRRKELRDVAFVFPAAPLTLAGIGLLGSRAWWLFDFVRMAEKGHAGAFEQLRREVPEGLGRARRMLAACLAEAGRQLALPPGRIVLGGFSQGAMLATDVALRLEDPPAALCVFSGTLLCEADWTRRARGRAGLRVLLTHGRGDPLLPFAGAIALRDVLKGAGLDVDFRPFDGTHTVGEAGLAALAELLTTIPAVTT